MNDHRSVSGGRREFPDSPRLGVGVVTLRGSQVLLVQRRKEPLRGYWSFPGGVVELGESLRDAAVREMKEETGLEVEIGEVADVFERVERAEDGRILFHYVVIDFVAGVKAGSPAEPRAGSDAAAARWVDCEGLGNLPVTPGVERVLRRALRWRAAPAAAENSSPGE